MSDSETIAQRLDRHEALSDGFEAACLTVVIGLDEPETAARFGIDLTDPVTVDSERWAAQSQAQITVAQGKGSSPVTVVVEDNGFEGSRVPLLERLSANGMAASIFWNVNGLAIFSCAQDGDVLWSGEVGTGEEIGSLPRSLRPLNELAVADLEADWIAIGAAMVEIFIGVDLPASAGSLDLPWYVLTSKFEATESAEQ